MPLPFFYSPITKLQMSWGGPEDTPCGQYYMDFMRCASRIGFTRAQFDCKLELEDFHECWLGWKQIQRKHVMEKERKRQGRDYMAPPPQDITADRD